MVARDNKVWPLWLVVFPLVSVSCVGPPARDADFRARASAPPNFPPPRTARPLMIPGPAPPAPSTSVAQAGFQRDPSQPAAPQTGESSPAAAPVDPAAKLRELYRFAADRCAVTDCYVARLRRREQVN